MDNVTQVKQFETEDDKKRKRDESSVSELETSKVYDSTDIENSPVLLTKKQQKRKKKENQKAKKAKIKEEMLTLEIDRNESSCDPAIEIDHSEKSANGKENNKTGLTDTNTNHKERVIAATESKIENELKEIKSILKNVLTKDDNSLKQIIVDTIKEMKDDLLNSMSHRIDILEGELHIKDIENDRLKEEIETLKEKDAKQIEKNSEIKKTIEQNKTTAMEHLNDIEQYQRRNNLRITGLNDSPNETAEQTANKICSKLNEYITDIDLDIDDIDIAHRLGKYKAGKTRSVIVRFISRNTKNRIIHNRKSLGGSDIYVNEDLTALNQEVLSSVRLKRKEDILYAYTYDGKIFAKWKNTDKVTQVHFVNFGYWLNLKWPKKDENETS